MLLVANKNKPAVIRDVQPLVGICCPRVGVRQPTNQVSAFRRCSSPHPKRSIDVYPGAGLSCPSADLGNGITSPSRDVADLCTDDRGFLHLRQEFGTDSALIVRRYTLNPITA